VKMMKLVTTKMLVAAMVLIDEDKVITLVERSLDQGIDPNLIMEEMQSGLGKVHKLYSEGTYFLSDLLIAAEVFKRVHSMVQEQNQLFVVDRPIDIIVGTVQNDIHDIGKSMGISIMQSIGFNVVDLGIDVKPEQFIETIQQTAAPILCLIGLLTLSYDYMKNTIRLLEAAGLREDTVVLIAGLVNDSVQSYVGANYWVHEVHEACEICKNVLIERSHQNMNIS